MDERERKATVEDLPEECLALVFSCLPSKEDRDAAALTCRRWRAVKARCSHTLHCNLWRQTGDPSHLPHRILSVLRSFPHILHIFINGYMQHLDDAFCAAFRNRDFAKLQSLHLSSMFADITNKGLVSLALGCPVLLHLAVHSPSVSDEGLHALACSCPLLVSLDVSYCNLITDAGIDEVLASCHDMEKLLINSCPNIKGWGLRHGKKLQALEVQSCRMGAADLAQGIHGMASLQVLRMPNIKGRRKIVAQIGESCKLLTVIDVSNCMILDNLAVQKIAQGCPDLRVCDMSRCHHVSLNGWQALALSAAKLEELDVSRCKQFCLASLLALQNGCPRLLKLSLLPDYFVWHLAIERFRVSRPDVKIDAYVRRHPTFRDWFRL